MTTQYAVQNGQECLFAELDASTFMDNHAGTAGGAVGSTSASLPVVLRCELVCQPKSSGVSMTVFAQRQNTAQVVHACDPRFAFPGSMMS